MKKIKLGGNYHFIIPINILKKNIGINIFIKKNNLLLFFLCVFKPNNKI